MLADLEWKGPTTSNHWIGSHTLWHRHFGLAGVGNRNHPGP